MNPVVHQSGPALLDIRHATVVFIGGRMTLADGSALDSRQPTKDAATSRAVQRALADSEKWWSVVTSIVLPTLDPMPGAFALVSGARTAARATADGELRRVSLKRVLRGGVGEVSFMRSALRAPLPHDFRRVGTLRSRQGDHMGSLGVCSGAAAGRWNFAKGTDFYLGLVADQLGAHVVVDATGTFVRSAYGPLQVGSLSFEFEDRSSARAPELVVLPDTGEMRSLVQRLLDGSGAVAEGAMADGGASLRGAPTARDAQAFLRFVVAGADCSITALLRDGEWQDPADLEAGRVLLLHRYDLKLVLPTRSSNRNARSRRERPRQVRRETGEVQVHCLAVGRRLPTGGCRHLQPPQAYGLTPQPGVGDRVRLVA